MALPVLPLLAGLARAAGSLAVRTGSSMLGLFGRAGGASAGRSFTQAAAGMEEGALAKLFARMRPRETKPQRFDLGTLAKRLGTPNPSQQQVDDEQSRIKLANRAASPNAMEHTVQIGGSMAKFAGGIGLATGALNALAKASNQAAVSQLRMYSPKIAALAAQQEAFAIRYNVNRGRMVSGTTNALGQSLMKLQEEYAPYAALGENLKNAMFMVPVKIATWAEGFFEMIGLTDMVRGINKSLGDNDEKKHEIDALQHIIRSRLHMPLPQRDPLNKRPIDPLQQQKNDANQMWQNFI